MTRVKICGLLEIEHVLAAAEAGTDFVGFVFAEGRHRITPDRALELVKAARTLETIPETVGVFAGFTAAEVNLIAEYCCLDHVQLSGDESWEFCAHINKSIIKTLHVSSRTTGGNLLGAIKEGRRLLKNKDCTFLLDTRVGTASGGTGRTFDWRVAEEIAVNFPVIVAGGLTPENVSELIRELDPWGVDVSSGVETAGRKDTTKIRDFIESVRRAELSAL